MNQDGFSLANTPGVPRHWLIGACVVIVGAWVIGQLSQAATFLNALLVNVTGDVALGFVGWGVLAFSYNALPYAALAALALHFSKRLDGRGPAAIGLRSEAWIGALPLLLVGLVAALPYAVRVLRLEPGWLETAGAALPFLIPGILIQSGAEEILFRGVLLASLVARYGTRNGVLLSAAVFALWQTYVGQGLVDFAVNVTTTFVFGLTSAALVLRQGHLGGAIALHFMWNLVGALDAGFYSWPSDFWLSYFSGAVMPWTWERLLDQESRSMLVLPLIFETMLVMLICRTTILSIAANVPLPTKAPAAT